MLEIINQNRTEHNYGYSIINQNFCWDKIILGTKMVILPMAQKKINVKLSLFSCQKEEVDGFVVFRHLSSSRNCLTTTKSALTVCPFLLGVSQVKSNPTNLPCLHLSFLVPSDRSLITNLPLLPPPPPPAFSTSITL